MSDCSYLYMKALMPLRFFISESGECLYSNSALLLGDVSIIFGDDIFLDDKISLTVCFDDLTPDCFELY